MMNVKIKKLNSDAVTPEFKSKGAAGFDLSATKDIFIPANKLSVTKYFNEKGKLKDFDFTLLNDNHGIAGTGLAFEIPEGYELEIRGRSGNAFKFRVFSFNGTIDSDYRGEVKLLLVNLSNEDISFTKGERVAQGVIKKIEQVEFVEVEELSDTERGTQGFGHTGLQ